ncbi:MAG: PhzF family phenazine biosynthesis protein [candidate division Zixibacteria bacterium]|nr:PhzF family phenazine biosynthesis protein [candidate division Zixibacteria bacterium]
MQKLQYHLVDVFTDRAFAGNQLAVFLDGADISDELMRKLAGELSLAETTFVLPSTKKECDFHVRIFTTTTEIPFAGHPTLGTAFVLAHEGKVKLSGSEQVVSFEEGVGIIPVHLEIVNGQAVTIRMKQPLPKFGSEFTNRFQLAELLSIDSEAIDHKHPAQVVGCGVPFLFIPLKNLDVIRNVKLRLDVWDRFLRSSEAPCVVVFTAETVHDNSTVHCRMFAPGLGVMEDAATGSANGPLGCYLVKHDIVSCDDKVDIISEQGYEMGRPSIINIEIKTREGEINSVVVGGKCVYIGQGYIEV